jgi:NAD kinase
MLELAPSRHSTAVSSRRLVVVTRKTPLEVLLERHGTYGQAKFYLESRGHDIASAADAHARFEAGLTQVYAAFGSDERRVRLDRADLPAFLFAPEDVVIVVGQDGLVPNVAKYLDGQLTIGINPDPGRYDGVLCRHPPSAVSLFLRWLDVRDERTFHVQHRTMALVEREDGQRLLALNEVFIGHRTHQSARYRLHVAGRMERQSSSGIICATGTGSTGWARSIARQRHLELDLGPEDLQLAWFVREPFPSVASQVELDFGMLGSSGDPSELDAVSEMGEDGVIFADGIEADYLDFLSGQKARLQLAEQRLNLVV